MDGWSHETERLTFSSLLAALPPRPAQEDVAVLGEEVAELLLRQAGKLLALQYKSLHAIQVLVPLLHQLFRLLSSKTHNFSVSIRFQSKKKEKNQIQNKSFYLCEGHSRLPGEEESCEVGLHLVFLLCILLHLGNRKMKTTSISIAKTLHAVFCSVACIKTVKSVVFKQCCFTAPCPAGCRSAAPSLLLWCSPPSARRPSS